jgi:pimeloyl-ACP methyl ester carboxylesterase
VTAKAFMAQIKAISSWPGVLSRAKDLRMPILVANGAHDLMLPAYRSFVLSQQAPDAGLVLYPDAGHAFLFQEIEDFAAQIDLFRG